MTSLCPAKYFVPDVSTKSAPSSMGRWLMGVQNVVSMQQMHLYCWHKRAMRSVSMMRQSGLVICSEKKSVAPSVLRIRSSSSTSEGSITVRRTPIFGNTLVTNCSVRR